MITGVSALQHKATGQPVGPVTLTYYMNRLQALQGPSDYFVTLNPPRQIRPEAVIAEHLFEHPVYTAEAAATQARLNRFSLTRPPGKYSSLIETQPM